MTKLSLHTHTRARVLRFLAKMLFSPFQFRALNRGRTRWLLPSVPSALGLARTVLLSDESLPLWAVQPGSINPDCWVLAVRFQHRCQALAWAGACSRAYKVPCRVRHATGYLVVRGVTAPRFRFAPPALAARIPAPRTTAVAKTQLLDW